MRTFILALAAIVPAFAIERQRDTRVRYRPKLQRRNGGCCDMGPASCTRDETEAKNQLAKRWSSYGASEKKECVGESTTGGEKSYVELLTCLEMSTG